MTDIAKHQRVLDTITGPAEKRLLVAMCERMPAWVTPDVLTALGLAGAAIIFAGYALSRISPAFLWLATFGLFVNWLGDSADGTLARVRHVERPKYGFYIDHTVDVIAEALVFLGFGVSPFVRFDLAALAYIGYLAMSVLVYVRTCVDGVFRISYSRLGPTEMRILLVVVNAVLFFTGAPQVTPAFGGLSACDVVLAAVAAALGVFFVGTLLKGLGQLRDVDQAEA
ncbi:MAG: CDP-alcohol phosphatidyltransferase family protein [Actinobacteria bacterium]|nr:MAG: CDP-alcohol phosphatidyltransferase family protein [Actinomycetota bacterium]